MLVDQFFIVICCFLCMSIMYFIHFLVKKNLPKIKKMSTIFTYKQLLSCISIVFTLYSLYLIVILTRYSYSHNLVKKIAAAASSLHILNDHCKSMLPKKNPPQKKKKKTKKYFQKSSLSLLRSSQY